MSKFKETINNELSYIKADKSANDLIKLTQANKKVITFPKAVAIAASFLLVFSMILIPINNSKSSFVIIANAQTASDSATPDSKAIIGDELNTTSYIELKSNEPNYINYNFNYILDETAEPTNLVNRYLFHSFNKYLDITVEGKNIETITYKINKGSLSSYTISQESPSIKKIHVKNTSADFETEMTINYDEQNITDFRFNPVISTDDFHSNLGTYFATETGEITNEVFGSSIIGYGHKDDNTLATSKEIKALKQYVKNGDMIGFYNYQNQIFKRLINDITLDITVTKTNGETETQTLEFLYTPDVLNELPKYNDAIEKGQTLSTGTLSARIKK